MKACPNSLSTEPCTFVNCNCNLMLALMQRKIEAVGFFEDDALRKHEVLHLLDILRCAREHHILPEIRSYCDWQYKGILSSREYWQ